MKNWVHPINLFSHLVWFLQPFLTHDALCMYILQELVAAYADEAKSTGNAQLMLTAAVSAGKGTIDAGYEIAEIAKSLDFINVMTYDFHGTWEQFTGHNSPLYRGAHDKGDLIFFNTVRKDYTQTDRMFSSVYNDTFVVTNL
uniref:GH18 domain-containing protein n=1 Tax=Hucho hucho TaxID=62062 RepID=A0A4W5LYV1_9TELE